MQLHDLPDHSPVWIFGADRTLRHEEIDEIKQVLRDFVADWSAHRVPLHATADVLHNRFVIVALDETRAGASGCSIDSLFRKVSELESHLALRLLDSSLVFYGDHAGNVQATDRGGFRKLATEGVISDATSVYDPALGTLGEVRRAWPAAAAESWHRSLLR